MTFFISLKLSISKPSGFESLRREDASWEFYAMLCFCDLRIGEAELFCFLPSGGEMLVLGFVSTPSLWIPAWVLRV